MFLGAAFSAASIVANTMYNVSSNGNTSVIGIANMYYKMDMSTGTLVPMPMMQTPNQSLPHGLAAWMDTTAAGVTTYFLL